MPRTILLALLLGLGCGGGARPIAATPAASSAVLPAIDVRLLAGGRWSPADARGQVVVLEVWATYCAPCREAFPRLDRLAARSGVAVIGLAVDDDDAVVQRFLAEVPAAFAIARAGEDDVRGPPLAIARLPTVFVLDRAGRVRFRGEELTEADQDRLAALVDRLLGE